MESGVGYGTQYTLMHITRSVWFFIKMIIIYWSLVWFFPHHHQITLCVIHFHNNDFQSETHDHEADDPTILAGQVFNETRRAVLNDPTRPIKRSFDEVLADHDNSDDSDDLPGFRQLRTRLQRVRAATLPPIPQDIDDVEIQAEWGRNWRGDQFLFGV